MKKILDGIDTNTELDKVKNLPPAVPVPLETLTLEVTGEVAVTCKPLIICGSITSANIVDIALTISATLVLEDCNPISGDTLVKVVLAVVVAMPCACFSIKF